MMNSIIQEQVRGQQLFLQTKVDKAELQGNCQIHSSNTHTVIGILQSSKYALQHLCIMHCSASERFYLAFYFFVLFIQWSVNMYAFQHRSFSMFIIPFFFLGTHRHQCVPMKTNDTCIFMCCPRMDTETHPKLQAICCWLSWIWKMSGSSHTTSYPEHRTVKNNQKYMLKNALK